MTLNRRKFLRETAMATGALLTSSLLPNIADANVVTDKITILHTNDVHSRLEAFPQDGSKNAGLGGVAARAALINEIRKEADNTLLLDAGDIFQGTPYFNLYKGEPEMKAMSMMAYDAATMGNHDFDAGMENYATQLQHAKFPIILCNYDFANTPMEGKTIPYKIYQKQNLKIGILGVGIELKGLVADSLYGNTVYHNPIEYANRNAAILRKEGCDMIICLSHLGDKYTDDKISDEILAKENFDIDLIIGGHTHRFFDQPKKYFNRRGSDTIVNQVGWAGIQLGRLDYTFSRSKKKNLTEAHTVVIGKNTS
ncbi:MAG: metallophosphoesterase [Chitinophagaceae bacterium]|nr:metallophosphoesterase [Chitinophagaceae bacterium]